MGRVEGKVVLITGAARGQGAEHAALLSREGGKVVLADIRDEGGTAAAQRIGGSAHYVHHDVASADSWAQVIATVLDRHGRLDVLINNAAISVMADIASTDADLFERVFRVNQLGTFLGIKHGAAAMSDGGVIINVSSVLGTKGGPQFIAYSATKWAIRGMTQTAAIELGPRRIRVNTIIPGIINTPMFSEALPTADIEELGKHQNLLGRMGRPEDVASAVLFLASEESSFVTGAEIIVDGGRRA